jgi:hypothetical protein
MKTRIISVLFLTAALSASVLSAAPTNNFPASISVHSLIAKSHGDQIKRGDSPEKVRSLFGDGSRKLTRNVWLYHGFAADLPQAEEQGCRTLIITFANDQVVDMKCVNDSAAAIITANLKLSPSATNIASKK